MTYTAENSEKAFIGCLILDPELIEIVKDRGMSVKWLKDERHKEIFEIVVQAFDEGRDMDLNTIVDKGFQYDYITELMDLATPAFFDEYAKNIGTARLNEAMRIRLERNPENPELIKSLIESFEDKFYVKKINDVKQIAKDMAEEVIEEQPRIEMKIKHSALNRILRGVRKKKLVFLGGRPGHRKTDFVIDIADHVLEQGFRVLYADFEMGEEDTFLRFFTKRKRIANTIIETRIDKFGKILTPLERVGLSDCLKSYADELEDRLTIICNPKINEIKKMAKSVKADMIVIDHIQLFAEEHPLRPGDTKPSHIESLCARLKKMSRELNVAVWAPSQVDRKIEGPPKKSDFKGSAGIEENGDVLIGIWWPHAEGKVISSRGKRCGSNLIEYSIAKNRGGPVGRDDLHVEITTGVMSEFSDQEDTHNYRDRHEKRLPTDEEL